ncbi:MAG: hypothetical protein U0R19_38895 [Bryobacteraceae bacterium]
MAGKSVKRSPLPPVKPARDICLELADHSHSTQSAVEFFGLKNSSDPARQAARVTDQFLKQNASLLKLLDVSIRRDYDGRDLLLEIESGSSVGAIPLRSPFTARHDFGLVIQPRFPWAGIGPMLAEMGWKISPTPLKLPLLKRSERRVPPWVLSFTILSRLRALLDKLDRRFEQTSELRSSPKGQVNWNQYATRHVPRGHFLSVPCTFPDLRDDRKLKGAIRFALEKQLHALETQSTNGTFIHQLIAFAESLLARVASIAARRPSLSDVEHWLHTPLRNDPLTDGLQAINWTIEDRGLAGLSDLEGIPWTLCMSQFFEAWVETILRHLITRTGGHLTTGRQRQTVAHLSWSPSYLGSQRSLIPDLILETEDLSFIVDAKYKRHWEEMQHRPWQAQNQDLQEQHRADLLQVLAYANLARRKTTVCCLIYPCSWLTWESLENRGRLLHRAELPYRGRNVHLWLTAVPMHTNPGRIATALHHHLRSIPTH